MQERAPAGLEHDRRKVPHIPRAKHKRGASKSLLTELLDGSIRTPGQLQGHVDAAPLVLHPPVSLQGDPRAGRLRDDGDVLEEEGGGGKENEMFP